MLKACLNDPDWRVRAAAIRSIETSPSDAGVGLLIARMNKEKGRLKDDIMANLANLAADQLIMLKLTLPERDNLYRDVIEHSNVLKVVALSGGYSRAEANERLEQQNGMVASFSRALSEGLSAQQSDEEFNAALDGSIASIFAASRT